MSRLGKAISAVAFAVLVLGLLYATVTTHTFMRPVSYSLDGYRVGFVRETPWGGVWAKWWSEFAVRSSDGTSLECHASGQAQYQTEPDNYVTYNLAEPLRLCAGTPGELIMRQRWQVSLFGIVPLLPHSQTFVIPAKDR